MLGKELLKIIEEHLVQNNLLLNNIEVDEVEVFEDFAQYLDQHLKEESVIKVMAITYDELLTLLKVEVQNKVEHILQEINQLSTDFYAIENKNDSLETLYNLLEECHELIKISEDYADLEDGSIFDLEAVRKLSGINYLFYQAVKEKDFIYIADLLHFELISILRKLVRS